MNSLSLYSSNEIVYQIESSLAEGDIEVDYQHGDRVAIKGIDLQIKGMTDYGYEDIAFVHYRKKEDYAILELSSGESNSEAETYSFPTWIELSVNVRELRACGGELVLKDK